MSSYWKPVAVVSVDGPCMTNVSKSRRSWQMLELARQMLSGLEYQKRLPSKIKQLLIWYDTWLCRILRTQCLDFRSRCSSDCWWSRSLVWLGQTDMMWLNFSWIISHNCGMLYSHTQHTPYPLAHDPEASPPSWVHSLLELGNTFRAIKWLGKLSQIPQNQSMFQHLYWARNYL